MSVSLSMSTSPFFSCSSELFIVRYSGWGMKPAGSLEKCQRGFLLLVSHWCYPATWQAEGHGSGTERNKECVYAHIFFPLVPIVSRRGGEKWHVSISTVPCIDNWSFKHSPRKGAKVFSCLIVNILDLVRQDFWKDHIWPKGIKKFFFWHFTETHLTWMDNNCLCRWTFFGRTSSFFSLLQHRIQGQG